jgi:hypothetical protein
MVLDRPRVRPCAARCELVPPGRERGDWVRHMLTSEVPALAGYLADSRAGTPWRPGCPRTCVIPLSSPGSRSPASTWCRRAWCTNHDIGRRPHQPCHRAVRPFRSLSRCAGPEICIASPLPVPRDRALRQLLPHTSLTPRTSWVIYVNLSRYVNFPTLERKKVYVTGRCFVITPRMEALPARISVPAAPPSP